MRKHYKPVGPTVQVVKTGDLVRDWQGRVAVALTSGIEFEARLVLSRKLSPLPANQRTLVTLNAQARYYGWPSLKRYVPRSKWEQVLIEFWSNPRHKQRDLDKFIKESYARPSS